MRCPSCRDEMEVSSFVNHIGSKLAVDVCWSCRLIWFDHLESSAMSAASVVEFFRAIVAHDSDERNIVAMRPACPTCTAPLAHTNDIGRSGRFSYFRCPVGDGRLIAFAQFLREKQFVRSLAPHELRELSMQVAQVRCSSCGGPISLRDDSACTHCGAAIDVLDRDAVAKTLASYQEKMQPRALTSTPVPMKPPLSPDVAQWSALGAQLSARSGGRTSDLVVGALAALFASIGD